MEKNLSPIFTKYGDTGQTRTLDGARVNKDDCLIEVNGDIDSLQTCIDKLIAFSLYSERLHEQKNRLHNV